VLERCECASAESAGGGRTTPQLHENGSRTVPERFQNRPESPRSPRNTDAEPIEHMTHQHSDTPQGRTTHAKARHTGARNRVGKRTTTMTPDIGFNIDFFSANKFVRGEKKRGEKQAKM